MEIAKPPLPEKSSIDQKRHCIRIKARIKIHSEQDLERPPYQAYCETVTSSRPQSPDVFLTPPTHSEPFQTLQPACTPTYTARITTRRGTLSRVSVSPSVPALSTHGNAPTETPLSSASDSKRDAATRPISPRRDTVSTNRYHTVLHSANPRSSHLGGSADNMSRNTTPSLSQVQQANIIPKATPQIITARTPLRQKRYGRMEYHPLPPLPPTPPHTPVHAPIEKPASCKTTVNFSRGEIGWKSPQLQKCTSVPHISRIDTYTQPPQLPTPVHHSTHLQSATAGHERPQSKASRRTVTFADNASLSSRSSTPDPHKQIHDRVLRQSKSFTSDAQIPSSLRLYRSHDSLLLANTNIPSANETSAAASRRTSPKDFRHKYTFGQRPAALMHPSPALGRPTNSHYNPRLSTSKAQYRGLATLPRTLPSSLRVAEPQAGPRQPPWGSLEDLEEQRGKRVDARERIQAKQFRAATLSEATTVGVGSMDSFGKEAMKREVEGYRKQVVSVYPDMAFDGSAGKGGRKECCCVVM